MLDEKADCLAVFDSIREAAGRFPHIEWIMEWCAVVSVRQMRMATTGYISMEKLMVRTIDTPYDYYEECKDYPGYMINKKGRVYFDLLCVTWR